MEKIFHRGSRCYGTSIVNTGLIFSVVYTHLLMLKWRNLFILNAKKFNDNILSVKRIIKFNDSFFKIKVYVYTPYFNLKKFNVVFKKALSGVKISYCWCSKWYHKVSFRHLKLNLISNNTSNDINTVNLSSTNLVNVNNGNHELIAPNIPNLNSQNPFSHSNTGKFSFCLSWNTNGWNFVKRDSIEYFNTIFKPLFICFQETGNDINDARNPCKVILPNYKYFQKRMDLYMPGSRGLYLGYHVSC